MIKKNVRAALTVAALFMAIASPAGANVVSGDVTFEETRCAGDCTGTAVNPLLDTISLGGIDTEMTGPGSLGRTSLVEGFYLGGDSFGFDFASVLNPSMGGIISGINFENAGTAINGITVSFDGTLNEAILFAAYTSDSVGVFIEKTTIGSSSVEAGRVTVDLVLNVPVIDPVAVTSVTAVPLPGTMPLLLAGLAGVGFVTRRGV